MGGAIGGIAGGLLGGPVGAVAGSLGGSALGGLIGGGSGGAGYSANAFNPPKTYVPTAQPQMDQTYQSLENAFLQGGYGMPPINQSPAAYAYPQAQSALGQLTNNPYANDAQYWANATQQYGLPEAGQQQAAGGYQLQNALNSLGYLPMLGNNAFSPYFGDITGNLINNPYYGQALGGAQQAAGIGGAGANQMAGAANAVLGTGFDPQSALFNQGRQQTLDAANAANAAAGLGASPYGAGNTAQALSNYGINWQNQQLGRQTQALGAAAPQFTNAANLAASSAALPSNVYTGQQNQILQALQAQNQAGIGGAGAMGGLLTASGQGLGQGAGLQNTGLSEANMVGQLPYQTSVGQAQIAQNAITPFINQGNQLYTQPEQALQNILPYLNLGQAASAQGQIGAANQAQGLGSLLGAANPLLFGSQGLSGALGINPTTGLLGNLFSGGGGADPMANAFPPVPGLTDFQAYGY